MKNIPYLPITPIITNISLSQFIAGYTLLQFHTKRFDPRFQAILHKSSLHLPCENSTLPTLAGSGCISNIFYQAFTHESSMF